MGAADDIKKGLTKNLATFTKQRKAEEKHVSAGRWRTSRMIEVRGMFQTEAADEVMEECYMKASDNNRLPATARQIFYVARPLIEEHDRQAAQLRLFQPDAVAELRQRAPRNVRIGTWSMTTAAISWSRTPTA